MPKKCMELLQKGAEIRKVNAFWALYLPKERKFGVNWALQNDFFLYAQISSCTAIQVKSLRLNQFLIFRFSLGEQTDHNIDGHFLLICSLCYFMRLSRSSVSLLAIHLTTNRGGRILAYLC